MALTVSVDELVAANRSPLLQSMPHWRRVRLREIGAVLNGFPFKSEQFTRQGGTPLVRIRDVGKNASETFYSGDFDPRYTVRSGDLLVGMDGDFNCARWKGPPALLNQRVCKVTVDASVCDPRWLDHVLPAYLQAINQATSSVTVKHLSSRTIEDIPLPLPPLHEQIAIVAELEKQFSRLDEAVAGLERVKAQLARYSASVLKRAIAGELVEPEAAAARRDAREFESANQFVQQSTPPAQRQSRAIRNRECASQAESVDRRVLPAGWCWATLSQLGELGRGKSRHRPRDDAALYGGPYPFIQTGDVRQSRGVINDYKQTYSELGLRQSRLWPAGTLCITIAANIAETGILKFDACFPDSVVGFVPHFGSPTTEYIEYFFRTAKEELGRFAPATAQKNINLDLLASIRIPVPPLAEQRRIVAEVDRRLSIVRGVEAEVDANLKRAQALRQAILAKAFSGAHA